MNGDFEDEQPQKPKPEAEVEEAASETEPNNELNEEVHVAATNPANRRQRNRIPKIVTHSEPEPQSTPPTENSEEDSVLDLANFDWDDFNRRYQTELNNITQDENDLVDEFDKFSEAFSLWAQSSTRRDNDRAAKRFAQGFHTGDNC